MRRRATLAERLRRLAERQPDFRERYSNVELAARFGVSRQAIGAAIGPRAARVTVRARLRNLEAREPDFRDRYTHAQLASRLGVSRQAVARVLGRVNPSAHKMRHKHIAERLTAFLDRHPHALRPRSEGGLTRTEIARAVGVPREIVRRVWRELGLPERAPDIPRLQRVLRIETCVECGREFEWTIGMETNYRQGMKKYVVCSVRCGAIGRSRRQREGS